MRPRFPLPILLLLLVLGCDEQPQAPPLDSDFGFVVPVGGTLLDAPIRILVQAGDGNLDGDLTLSLDGDSLATVPGPPWVLDWDLRFWADGEEHVLVAELFDGAVFPIASDTVRVTLDAAAYAFPAPLSPADTAILDPELPIRLDWRLVADVEAVQLQFATDPVFAAPLFAASLADTTASFDFDIEQRWYYWRLRPDPAVHDTPWGATQRLHVGPVFATLWGGPDFNIPMGLARREDGVTLVVGVATGPGGLGDGFLAAVSPAGELLWERSYGDAGSDAFVAIQPWQGDYLLAGEKTLVEDGDLNGWLILVDREGNPIWERAYGGPGEHGFASLALSGAGPIAAGFTASEDHLDNRDFWLLAVYEGGAVRWERSYGDEESEWAHAIAADPLGEGFAVAGNRIPPGDPDDRQVWLLAGSAEGDTLWSRSYGVPFFDDHCYDMVWSPGEGFMLCTQRDRSLNGGGPRDLVLIRCDAQGHVLSEASYGGPGDDYPLAISSTGGSWQETGFVVAGTRDLASGDRSISLLRVDADGEIVWDRSFGRWTNGIGRALLPAGDGWLVAGQRKTSPGSADLLNCLILTDPFGESIPGF